MEENSRELIVDGGNGIRLLGFHSQQSHKHSKGLFTLIHGWEGSVDSTYILSTGRYLFEHGYDIFRLNLRDHGNSHHLNEGLFHGALLDETFQAICNISMLAEEMPYYLIGFSLGGNFALRIALKNAFSAIPNLKHVFCISPVIDPYKATVSIDNSPIIYRAYFLKKWKKSLLKKMDLFPEKYKFSNILKYNSCMAITDDLVSYFSDFANYREYFDHYTLLGDVLGTLSTNTTIIASKDDPILSIGDLYHLKRNDYLNIIIEKYGGHCGFLNFFPFQCWYEKKIEYIARQYQS